MKIAKTLCGDCPAKAQAECFRQGLMSDRECRLDGGSRGYGVFGGYTPAERDQQVKKARITTQRTLTQRRAYTMWTPDRDRVLILGIGQGARLAALAAELGVSEDAAKKRAERLRTLGFM